MLAGAAELLIVAPEGVASSEYQLLHLRENKDNREFRTVTGGFLHAQSGSDRDVVPFDAKKLANHTYALTLPAGLGSESMGFCRPARRMEPVRFIRSEWLECRRSANR